MPSSPAQDAYPLQSSHYSEPQNSLIIPKIRGLDKNSPYASLASLPFRRSNASLSSLFASTSSLPSSRPSSSGTATPPTGIVAHSAFLSDASRSLTSPSPTTLGDDADVRNLIIRSFAPHVAIHASVDTKELLHNKGLRGGLLELLRPFGETVQGRVTIRDSTGASRSWDDFGIRFTGMRDGLESPRLPDRRSTESARSASNGIPDSIEGSVPARLRTGGDIPQIEEVVDRHLSHAEYHTRSDRTDYLDRGEAADTSASPSASPFYSLYLRRLLSGLPMTPHETFSHPVACVMAISSRNPSPIEELRRLYASTTTGDYRLPQWVNNEFLRYYVLIHDEDHDDAAKSMSLYEQMKRHFGLHCHLLRLRSSQCVSSDDDSVKLPLCQWISAAEELAEIQRRESYNDDEDPTPCVFESDATALKSFVREMVTQSIIPTMERLSATWNDQVASRRRGISGRFMSLSKRWTPFSTSIRSATGPPSNGSGSNYDALQGFYRPDTPEATMRKLADYAFMLRDFKLAQSTYDLLRTDFSNDKAWKNYAGANEMAAISTLLASQSLSTKARLDTVDQMLETACYSYITRCAAPYSALRTLALGLELLKLRGASAADDAARWASRILELRLVGPIGHALVTERIAACFVSRGGVGSLHWGARRRKAALWAVLGADGWLRLEKGVQARKCVDEACRLYGVDAAGEIPLAFKGMRAFVDELREAVRASRMPDQGVGGEEEDGEAQREDRAAGEETLVEVSETLTLDQPSPVSHRKSLTGAAQPAFEPLGDLSLSPSHLMQQRDDGFG
ncbi:ER-golgi trafficking TRAPP I complex 85 kDa subunit-domain-containing protein [Cryomyces antarcticus]